MKAEEAIEILRSDVEERNIELDKWSHEIADLIERMDGALAEIEAEANAWASPTEKQVHAIMNIARKAREGDRKERDQLRAALEKFGRHLPTCIGHRETVHTHCDCGFSKALNGEGDEP